MKFLYRIHHAAPSQVSTLVVEWIEIIRLNEIDKQIGVSTLVVEWIEILTIRYMIGEDGVSTLVVEWIEILMYCW